MTAVLLYRVKDQDNDWRPEKRVEGQTFLMELGGPHLYGPTR